MQLLKMVKIIYLLICNAENGTFNLQVTMQWLKMAQIILLVNMQW